MSKYKQMIVCNQPTLYYVSKNGEIISKYKHKVHKLKVFKTKTGYLYVKLWINNKNKAEFIHRAVAKAYIPNPENKPEVNHKDGIKTNNCVDNLEWVTSKENKIHARKYGLSKFSKGEDNGKSIYTNKQIEKVCKLLESNKYTVKEISEKTDVSTDTIYSIRTKNIWSEISKKYNIPKVQKISNTVYTNKQIEKVCKLLESNKYTVKEISEKTDVKKSTVNDILHKRRWQHISDNYKF